MSYNISFYRVAYYEKLLEKVGMKDDGDYGIVLRNLFEADFIYPIPMDKNRADDAIELRLNIFDEIGRETRVYQSKEDITKVPPKLLEVMVALSERMSYLISSPEKEDSIKECFFDIFRNAGFNVYKNTSFVKTNIEDTMYHLMYDIDTLLYRQYEFNGVGGFFPLIAPREDQRHVELWYQMQAYLDEKYSF